MIRKKVFKNSTKKVSRLISLLVVGSLIMASLTGCSKGNKTEDTSENATTISASPTEAVTDTQEEPYEIVMIIPTLGSVPSGIADVEAAINEKVGPELGVKVKLNPISLYDLNTQQDLMIMNGDKVDLILPLYGLASYVSKGEVLALDDLYAKYGSDIEATQGVAVKSGYYDGKLYGIPATEKQGIQTGFMARKDICDELGFSFDANKTYTLEDLETLFAAYKEKYGDGYYCLAGTSSNSDFYSFFNAIDSLGSTATSGVLMGAGFDDDTTVTNLFETQEYADYSKRMYEWAQKGYFSPDAATNTDANTTQIQSGYYLGCLTNTETDMVSNLSRDCGYEMEAITLVDKYSETSMFQLFLWSISSTCENPEKTFQFLNYLYADNDIDNMLTNGLEGKTYKVIEKGDKEGRAVIAYADGVNAANAPYIMPLHVFGDKLSISVFEPMTLDYFKMADDYNKNIPENRKSKTLGYVFNSTNVSTKKAAVDAVYAQYAGMIACGTQNPDQLLKEFKDALKSAGIDEVIAENQKQLDEWLQAQK